MKLVFDYILVEYRQPEGYFSTRHQYNISWYCRYKIDRITLVNRILQEAQYKDYFSSDKGKHLQDFYIRDKVTLRYKHNKQITSYIADEVYYRMDYGYFKGFNRNRLYAGILWSITKTNQLELFYLIENNYNVSRPSNNYIIGIGYNMNLF